MILNLLSHSLLIMVEFILWTDNPKTDIDKISHYIGIQPTEKREWAR